MLENLFSIGWRPVLAGGLVLVIAVIAGWGMAGDASFAPARWLRTWIKRVILPGLRRGTWLGRFGLIFLNNASICAVVIWAGGWPGGSWVAVALVGVSLGAALRMLTDPRWGIPLFADEQGAEEASSGQAGQRDRASALGMALNLLELPAIAVTLGLAMGRLAVPNGLSPNQVWQLYACGVLPLLAAAAGGEALWIGRRRVL